MFLAQTPRLQELHDADQQSEVLGEEAEGECGAGPAKSPRIGQARLGGRRYLGV
jgi:hypothetical protein